jgi:signal transduction histidine kinase
MAFNGSISLRANYEAARFMKEVAQAWALGSELSPHEQLSSLGAAFAAVPSELGLQRVAGYRVVVEGRERELKRSLRGEVYRIIQEAIVNAYSHSGAKEIETEIAYRSTELRIAVRDNGCGIDPHRLQWRRNGHWGLQRMREQADRIGARLRVWSRTPFGTEVELRVPGGIAFEQSRSAYA